MKKQYYNKLTWLFLGLLITASSCKKNYTVPPGTCNKPSTVRLIQYGDNTNNTQFEYDLSGNVSKLTYVTGTFSTAYNVVYQNGAPSQMVTANSVTKLSYINGLLQKADLYNNNGQNLQTSTVLNYVNNRLSQQIEYQQGPNGLQPGIRSDYTYLANGDIDVVSVFLWDVITNQYQLFTTFKCEYDNHPNPLYPLRNFYLQFFAIPASPHNITKITGLDQRNALSLGADYKYTYNQDGYPASAQRTVTQPGAAPDVSQVKYSYQ